MPPPEPYANRQVIDVHEVVRELSELGLNVDVIAKVTSQSPNEVRTMIAKGTVTDRVEEKRLEDDFRRLMQAAMTEAFKTLQFGPASEKHALVRAMLSNTGRTVGKNDKLPNDDIRRAFTQLVEDMTEIGPAPEAAPAPANDNNEETRRTEARLRLHRSD